MFDEPLITERCVLARLTTDDDEHVWTAAHTPGFTDGMTWEPPKDMEEIHEFTKQCIAAWDTGEKYVWSIKTKNGTFVGRMETKFLPELEEGTWTIGYWIHPLQQGKGYATEAARAAVDFSFEKLNARQIISSHADWNTASGRVMEKIGMKHDGFSEGRTSKNGKPVRAAEYRIDREEWEARK